MHYDHEILSPDHMRQIYYYATNKGPADDVSAALVYAGTGEAIDDCDWTDQDYRLGCYALDLNVPFNKIAAKLDAIALSAFGPLSKTDV